MSATTVFVHDRALCESDTVGGGTRIWAFAHVMRGATIGRDCNIGGGAFVEGGVTLGEGVIVKNNTLLWDGVEVGDHAFIGPNVVFTNDLFPRADPRFKIPPDAYLKTRVGRGTSIGANATVICGVSIGPHAMVGSGAVVVRDVPAHALVFGNPASQRGWVCLCGKKLSAALDCTCGRRFEHASNERGLTALDSL